MSKQKTTYKVTTRTGEVLELSTTRQGIIGAYVCRVNDEGWSVHLTTKNPQAACDKAASITGRPWLSDWHVASMEVAA